jgi:hypothetical protein
MACEPGIVRGSGGRGTFLAHAAGILFAATAMLAPAQIPSGPAGVPNAPAPIPAAPAQSGTAPESKSPPSVKERFLVDRFPDKPSVPPSFTIPIEPLGFTAPGAIYMGSRNSMASLDFIDEDRLLFTFRVPGLLHRDFLNNDESNERQIRAVVVTLPQGTVTAEALWTVHDRVRYLWPLKDGHFLFRDGNNLSEGDSALTLKPYLDFPGSLLWIELDPEQHFLVTSSREPVAKPAQSGIPADGSSYAGWKPGKVASPSITSPSSASASITSDPDPSQGSGSGGDSDTHEGDHHDLVIRILHRESGEVMLVSRVRAPVHLPINSVGYLENLRSRGMEWMLNLSYFSGGSKMLGHVDSNCEPDDNFLSEQEILAIGCGPNGEGDLVALTTTGRTLWRTQGPANEVWPQLAVAANGSRLAWETLDTTHPIYTFEPIEADEVKEQSVTIFDAANGDIALVSPVSPILDAGGNIAISPSGRCVAILNDGAIQVFELPLPAPLPADALDSDKQPSAKPSR